MPSFACSTLDFKRACCSVYRDGGEALLDEYDRSAIEEKTKVWAYEEEDTDQLGYKSVLSFGTMYRRPVQVAWPARMTLSRLVGPWVRGLRSGRP